MVGRLITTVGDILLLSCVFAVFLKLGVACVDVCSHCIVANDKVNTSELMPVGMLLIHDVFV